MEVGTVVVVKAEAVREMVAAGMVAAGMVVVVKAGQMAAWAAWAVTSEA